MSAYYNEFDPFAAQWLRNLIAAGHIAAGDVDERSIVDVTPSDLAGYTQCHFFAGIGVWSYALRLAGWPDDRPVWTGSCPCQPFSAAGKGAGFDDERHLWPAWQWLIAQRRPPAILGEQVASKDAEPWLDLVQADMEALDYSIGAVPFPSAGIGAPHIRDRLYWLANNNNKGLEGWGEPGCERPAELVVGAGGVAGGVADTNCVGPSSDNRAQSGVLEGAHQLVGGGSDPVWTNPTHGFWRDADWLLCRDGKWRPVEPGTFPLAHGATSRVGRLRGYGNAINAQAAKTFIEVVMECQPC